MKCCTVICREGVLKAKFPKSMSWAGPCPPPPHPHREFQQAWLGRWKAAATGLDL